MSSEPFCLAVILARGGSKRLPGKNIRPLAGKPLISYVISSAIKAGRIDDVIVSTDCKLIQSTAVHEGAKSPFLRPAELAMDETSSMDSLVHAVDAYESMNGIKVDYVVMLQPTSPFTTPRTVDECLARLIKENGDFLFTVVGSSKRAEWHGSINGAQFSSFFSPEELTRLSKEAQYTPSGNAYAFKRESIRADLNLLLSRPLVYEVSREESIDIDYEIDFRFAEFMIGSLS